ncbi:hypothetical protein BS78_04G092900 [Paspalum vaginatum]|nr:hypothetical protein BS78_04G092900 [Paspalum vaginatum]
MGDQNCAILDWNVRGMNSRARRGAVRDLIRDSKSTIVCLQETMMQQIDCQIVAEVIGPEFQHSFVALPADGTRGGVLLAVQLDHFQIASSVCSTNAITARIQSTHSSCSWWIIVVYGPQTESDKMNFLQELRQLSCISGDEWLVIGDFNLIVSAEDKSNDNINQ